MDPATVVTLITTAVPALVKILSREARKEVGREATEIVVSQPESPDRVRDLFNRTKDRLRLSWTMGLMMSAALFLLFFTMVVAAVASGLIYDKPTYSLCIWRR